MNARSLWALARLSWRRVAHERGSTLLLVLAVALAALLPLAAKLLVERHSEALLSRARATPLVLGAPGSRVDLVLRALYFRAGDARDAGAPEPLPPLPLARYLDLVASGRALAIPLHVQHRAQGLPIVGTTTDYFAFRGLAFAAGEPFLELGECVLGARAAQRLSSAVGSGIRSDQGSLYDLKMRVPVRLRVAGVLAASGGPDDDAIFCDLKTDWILAGLGHGHADARAAASDEVLGTKALDVTLGAALKEFEEVTPENAASFHFHGDLGEYPLSAVLVAPVDARAATILKAREANDPRAQLVEPVAVIEEILGFVVRLKRFFDAHVVLVGAATLCFLVLVALLSLRLRAREAATLRKLGGARSTVATLMGIELSFCVGLGLALAGLGALLLTTLLPPLV